MKSKAKTNETTVQVHLHTFVTRFYGFFFFRCVLGPTLHGPVHFAARRTYPAAGKDQSDASTRPSFWKGWPDPAKYETKELSKFDQH